MTAFELNVHAARKHVGEEGNVTKLALSTPLLCAVDDGAQAGNVKLLT